MTQHEQLELLKNVVKKYSQAEVARRIAYTDAAISGVLNGRYPGSPANLLRKIEEVFGSTVVDCPVLGEIALAKCAENRRRQFAATNPLRVQLYRACKVCDRGKS